MRTGVVRTVGVIGLAAALGTLSAAVVLGVAGGLDRWLAPALGVALPGSLVRESAATAFTAAALTVLVLGLRRPTRIDTWRRGAIGERSTAEALTTLEPDGWIIYHDRRLPGRRANIDHIALGPGGVWVVETKHWSGRLTRGAGHLRQGRRPADAVYDQVWDQAEAVTRRLPPVGVRARPVVCVVGGEIVTGRDRAGRPVRGPVEFHSPAGLAHRLSNATVVLTPAQVRAAAAAIDRALPPA